MAMSYIEGLEERALLTSFVPRVLDNGTPVATPATVTTPEDKPFAGQLTATNPNSEVLTFTGPTVTSANGKLSINNATGTFSYIPPINFYGSDSFAFVVTDPQGNSSNATVNISVSSVNDPPTVIDGSASPDEDLAFPGTVATLASDVDVDTLTFTVVTAPVHGKLTLNSNGTFTYTPNANYNGPDQFTFKANDTHADSEIATFNLTVNPVDDALSLSLPSATTQIARNSSKIRLDPAATLQDIDTVVNYAKTQFRLIFDPTATTGVVTPGDLTFGRMTLTLQSQGDGLDQVNVKGSKVYYNGTQIASVTGGNLGHALVIKFSNGATEAAVNAVLRQISIQASKKATVGTRTIDYTISAGGQSVFSTKTIAVN